MQTNTKVATAVAVSLTLAACGGFELQKLGGVTPVADPYYSTLYAGYRDRAEHDQDYGHYASADAFAMKALQVAGGEDVTLFTPNDEGAFPDGTVPADEVGAMMDGRKTLMDLLQAGAAKIAPVDSANAQVMYDCWVEEQSYIGDFNEDNQPDHAAFCRDGFNRSLAIVQEAMKPKPVVAKPAPAPAPMPEPMVEVPNSYLTFFDWDSSVLSGDASQIIAQAADNARRGKVTRIIATGHADTSGTSSYNDGLSQRRAESVARALVAQGIPNRQITVESRGEAEPLVPTGDGVREPQNRRVSITFPGR